jgi:hypothetical protein
MKTIDEMDVQELRETGYSLPEVSVDALDEAQRLHRPHSLIGSHRFWQQVASAPGVVAWGYAYEGGEFHPKKQS